MQVIHPFLQYTLMHNYGSKPTPHSAQNVCQCCQQKEKEKLAVLKQRQTHVVTSKYKSRNSACLHKQRAAVYNHAIYGVRKSGLSTSSSNNKKPPLQQLATCSLPLSAPPPSHFYTQFPKQFWAGNQNLLLNLAIPHMRLPKPSH